LGVLAACLLFEPGWRTAGQGADVRNIPPGQFARVYFYERGLEHGNPGYNGRFRVNSPEAVLHPQFGKRSEARENGLMRIRAEEDLSLLTGAGLYLELWGGHPGTAHKRVTINGRGTYELPRVGTEDNHCTYSYPTLPLKITDLVNGYNAVQFACDQGSTFWGHYIVDNAALCLNLTNPHPALARAGLAEFAAAVKAAPAADGREMLLLQLDTSGSALDQVAAVDYQGYYTGYDENGNGRTTDFHGFTKRRQGTALLGRATAPPFVLAWDTSMLPDQRTVGVRAVVHFRHETNLVYATEVLSGVPFPARNTARVVLCSATDLPRPFWSRAGNKRQCVVNLDADPERISRAELHVVAWTGGAGTIRDYFTLNGQRFPVAEGAAHELIYSRLPVQPGLLRRGANRVELLSDTEHHGIEVLLPGPALMVRYEP
jgi:hypothetical protein